MIYMTEFNRVTMRCMGNAAPSGLNTFDSVIMMFGTEYIHRGERSLIYHTSESTGLIFADHDLFSVDYPVNNN